MGGYYLLKDNYKHVNVVLFVLSEVATLEFLILMFFDLKLKYFETAFHQFLYAPKPVRDSALVFNTKSKQVTGANEKIKIRRQRSE